MKVHRNYTVDEVSRTVGVCKGTVRRWLKENLPALRERKPILILGSDLIDFLKARARPRTRCDIGEFYCLKCREARRAAFGEAEIASETPASMNLRALCEMCGTLMHRRVSRRQLAGFLSVLRVSAAQPPTHIGEPAPPSLNVHVHEDAETHEKASS
ncbi:MAG: helix-turn-helix domain-containing protein [Pseudomonadota bacterium]|nr:helix-turn-helix domain-containing protein [Pseudomonadota bacterium]